MYPVLFTIFGKDIPTYGMCIAVGLILCAITLFVLIKRRGMPEKIFDEYLFAAMIAIIAGFGSAAVFQAFYNWQATGVWTWGGITFMGGMVGGVAVFVLYFFLFFKNKKTKQAFWDIADFAAACIFIAHSLGRIGCFFGGCCYGKEAHGSIFGVNFPEIGYRYPTQLFEAAFLFIMFIVTFLYAEKCKKRGFGVGIWAISYGIFRFVLEYLRDDYRGGIEGAALSPSQVQSIIFVVVGIAYIALVFYLNKKGLIVHSIDWSDELKAEAEKLKKAAEAKKAAEEKKSAADDTAKKDK